MADGQVVFEVELEHGNVRQELQQVTRDIQREADNWEDAVEESTDGMQSSFGSSLKKIVGAISAAAIGKKLLDIGKAAIQAASDLEEVQNVVDVTFGANGASKIDKWAKQAGTQFGLTETQAKRFTSTLGAMMKSSGMTGDEIVDMSTDLAGLAADMASFYNLDFDTAFQKIRSGISGETEPLKQLGINMSVANLNAFALQKGLSKTFDQMTQGEQTMLRYQYLMEATADAQGDFARTTDGYANGMRALETNISTLTTNLGTVLLDVVNPLISAVNQLFPGEKTNKWSILDDVAEIQLNLDEKIAEITEVKAIADELIVTLEDLGRDNNAQVTLEHIATGANALDSSSKGNWEALLGTLQGIDGLDNLFGDEDGAVQTVEDLASALAGESVTMTKAQAWQTFLGTLADNAEAVSQLTGDDAESTAEWLHKLAQTAAELTPDDAAAWDQLLGALLGGIDTDTEKGRAFVETLTEQFLAMGSDSTEAVNGLKALGYTTDEIEQKQATWLRVCKELAKTIPGLSSIIDTNTGEIKGGIPAIKQYADEWERTAKYQAEIEAIRAQREIYEAASNAEQLQAEVQTQRAKTRGKLVIRGFTKEDVDRELDNLSDVIQEAVDNGAVNFDLLKAGLLQMTGSEMLGSGVGRVKFVDTTLGIDPERVKWLNSLTGEARDAVMEYAEAEFQRLLTAKEAPIVLEGIADSEERVAEKYGVTTEQIEAETKAAQEAAKSMTTLEKAANGDAEAMQGVQTAVEDAGEALLALANYAESVHDSIRDAIESTAKGLNGVDFKRNADQIERITELTQKQAQYEVGSDAWNELQRQIDSANESLITTDKIYTQLEQQAAFLDAYLENMRRAREMGLSDAFLASLSDGSVESAQYLDAIVNGRAGATAAEIDAKWQEIQGKKDALASELASQQLTVDEAYQTLAERAKEAIDALDLEGEAAENSGKTVAGIAQGIADHIPEVQSAVDGIIAELERLNGFGINIDFGGFGSISFTTSAGHDAEGSHRFGLDFVPHDDYLARLHQGERVLTAQENMIWNSLRNGGIAGFDLDALGGVMRDNVKPGGNVYLDGRIVGSVVSDQQGKSYRQLQRSGWQA